MDNGPLVTDEIEGGRRLIERFDDRCAKVSCAFWLRVPDELERYLYIASDEVDDRNFDAAVQQAMQLAEDCAPGVVDPFRIRVVWSGDQRRIVHAAQEVMRKFPARLPIRQSGGRLGETVVEDLYLYPPLVRTQAA